MSLPEQQDEWVGLWDRENPRSVWFRVRPSMRKAMDGIPEQTRLANPDLLYKNHRPSESLQNARFAFWGDFDRHETRPIVMSHVFGGSRSSYYDMLGRAPLLMWFLTAPKDFVASQKSILDRTHQLVREALVDENLYIKTIKIKTHKDGSTESEETTMLNVKALAEARKLMDSMTDRVQGTLVGKVAVKHQHEQLAIDPLSSMTSIDAIMDAGDDTTPMLSESPVVYEAGDFLAPQDPDGPESDPVDISEFLDDE